MLLMSTKVYDLMCHRKGTFGDFPVATFHNYEDAEREATRRNTEETLFTYWVESYDSATTNDNGLVGNAYPCSDHEDYLGGCEFC